MSKEVAPEAVMVFLNTLFALFDALCDKHGVMKVETAGDCYIVAGGILDLPGSKGREKQQVRTPHNGQPVVIRIGLHTGNCVSGLESTCIPGRIQLSAATASLMPHELLQPTGGIQVKGQQVQRPSSVVPQAQQ
ncbi:guanylate cyclase [Haematococcus lacustris]|uniref:Guanylate cyclase n=1 Tax=Haematococcus lacustris TaxID=44745 RepID=A0A699YKL3_HAELA|nr:guanylate cyclase [Haematococcus lacustris]